MVVPFIIRVQRSSANRSPFIDPFGGLVPLVSAVSRPLVGRKHKDYSYLRGSVNAGFLRFFVYGANLFRIACLDRNDLADAYELDLDADSADLLSARIVWVGNGVVVYRQTESQKTEGEQDVKSLRSTCEVQFAECERFDDARADFCAVPDRWLDATRPQDCTDETKVRVFNKASEPRRNVTYLATSFPSTKMCPQDASSASSPSSLRNATLKFLPSSLGIQQLRVSRFSQLLGEFIQIRGKVLTSVSA